MTTCFRELERNTISLRFAGVSQVSYGKNGAVNTRLARLHVTALQASLQQSEQLGDLASDIQHEIQNRLKLSSTITGDRALKSHYRFAEARDAADKKWKTIDTAGSGTVDEHDQQVKPTANTRTASLCSLMALATEVPYNYVPAVDPSEWNQDPKPSEDPISLNWSIVSFQLLYILAVRKISQ